MPPLRLRSSRIPRPLPRVRNSERQRRPLVSLTMRYPWIIAALTVPLFVGMLIYEFVSGKIPSRGAARPITKSDNPRTYWFAVTVHSVALAAYLAWLVFRLIVH